MAQGSDDAPVHRLVDMEVREVSLVDRAANKRRFLIVKRSDMGQESALDAGNRTDGDGNDADNDSEGHDGEGVLGVAASALEGLTDVITRLQSADGDAQRGEIKNLVSELRAAADKLTELDESNAEKGDDDDSAEGEGADDSEPGSVETRFDALLTSMNNLVGELSASRTRKAVRDEEDEEEVDQDEDEPPIPPRKKPKMKADAKPLAPKPADQGLRGDIRALRGELKGLTGSLQQHGQRLSRLEKRTGVPASRLAGERPAGDRRQAERAWPLDLNAPRNA